MVLPGLLQSKAAELMAIASAALFPLGMVFLKKGYDHSTPIYGTIVITAINAAVLWIVAILFSPTRMLLPSAILLFILGGMVGHGIARYLQFISIHLIGPARNTTALTTSGIFSSVIAIIFLGEKLTLPVFIGTMVIVGGVAVLAWESKKAKWKPAYLIYPIAAAFLYGVMNSLYKSGFKKIPDAVFGGAIGLTAALAILLVIATASSIKENKAIKLPKVGKALPLFLIAGLINSLGLILNFEALKRGNITVVFPLIMAQPLFATLYGYLFLRQQEKITWHVVAGAIVVVAGVVLLTLA